MHLPQLSDHSSVTEVWSALNVASVSLWLGMRERRGAWNTLP
jgi:hypothetical protein